MKWLLFILTIQFAYAQDHCQRVPEIAKSLELQLMSKRIAECDKTSAEMLNQQLPNPIEHLTAEQVSTGEKSKCDHLSTVQAKIDALENRLIVLDGFKTLKNDIAESKEQTNSPSLKDAKEGAIQFSKNLEIARSFDLLLNSNIPDSDSFLIALSKIKEEDRKTPEQIKAQIQKLCPKETELVVCKSDFSVESVDEINGLLKETVTDEKIKSWKSALSIKKKSDDTPWSFSDMYDELGTGLKSLSSQGQVEPSVIKKIKELPDFADAPTGLKFIDEMKTVKDSKILNNELTKQSFTSLLSETQSRHAAQTKGKVSYLWTEYNKNQDLIKDEEAKTSCVAAYKDYDSAVNCLNGLKEMAKAMPSGAQQTTLQKMIESIESSVDYNKSVASLQAECSKDNSKCVNEFTQDQASLTNELLVLKKIQEKILAENDELKTWRNFAFESTDSQKCLQRNSIDVSNCSSELASLISPQAFALTVDAIQMTTTMVSDPSASQENILKLCESKETLTLVQEDLCKVAKGESVNKPDPKKYTPDVKYSAVTDPGNDYNPSKTAIAQGLSNLLGAASRMFMNPVSPYPSYNYMNTGAMKPLSISDNIISSARSQSGYGVYSGVTPSMSRYFTK